MAEAASQVQSPCQQLPLGRDALRDALSWLQPRATEPGSAGRPSHPVQQSLEGIPTHMESGDQRPETLLDSHRHD